ncbi:ssDNA binding protein [Microbacterium phage Cassita]|nr:ssDNA binding protein [Microbacterium phage Cassita]
MVNDNNYIGATLTLVGYAAGEPEYPPYDKEGKRGFKQLSIAINEGYKKDGEFVKTGTTWYRVEKHQDDWASLGVQKGDKVRIDNAKQEVRSYKNAKGEDALGITLSYADVTVLESSVPGAAHEDQPF